MSYKVAESIRIVNENGTEIGFALAVKYQIGEIRRVWKAEKVVVTDLSGATVQLFHQFGGMIAEDDESIAILVDQTDLLSGKYSAKP